MLSFVFQSSAVLLAIAAIGLMWALRRHNKYNKFTKWATFTVALIAGAAISATIVADWALGLLGWGLDILGAPQALIGVGALVGLVVIVSDLLDREPDGAARKLALVVPTLLVAAGGQLGVFGDTLSGQATSAGTSMLTSLMGGV